MKTLKLILASVSALVFASAAAANPWKVQEGSTLLDGTETATYVAGFMFSGKEYEFTSAQVNLMCIEKQLVMSIVGDSDLLAKAMADADPTVEFIFKVGSDLISTKATIESVEWDRERARVHDGPAILKFFRQHDGNSAQVQLPVARTGVPEVRNLSLENVVETTDLVVATCGPLEVWEATKTEAANPKKEPTGSADKPPMDLETELSIGLAQKIVEKLMRDQNVTFDEIVKTLEPLANMPPE